MCQGCQSSRGARKWHFMSAYDGTTSFSGQSYVFSWQQKRWQLSIIGQVPWIYNHSISVCTYQPLEIAGCWHGLAQWAVNMYQGEISGYADFIQIKRMQSKNVKLFWEDVVCRYWSWTCRNGLLAGCRMKPALSLMHAKAHSWSFQVMSLIRHNM